MWALATDLRPIFLQRSTDLSFPHADQPRDLLCYLPTFVARCHDRGVKNDVARYCGHIYVPRGPFKRVP